MIPPGQWERVASVYEAAKAQPSGERDAFLRAACGDDAALRREVESLLAEDGREGPLDTPLWNTATTPMQAGERLSIGTTLGPYRIDAIIGRGGMGEVYRARDTNLGRDVALKVVDAHHAEDAERLARFQREAQLLATLNHPNIATVHGLETSTAVRALVLEFVDGQTLAERLARGPMPVDEALDVSRQIAEALQAAHDKGIVHRDLKPANIKITPDSSVKVLDFGLARLVEPDGQRRTDSSMSPTITTPAMTAAGVILGTAAYMSPEQAKGTPADKRSDIWAFGCVLYEMLTGKRAFAGEDVAETLASVLKTDPDWTTLPGQVPLLVRALLRDCLMKQRRDRITDVAAIIFALREVAIEPRLSGPPLRGRARVQRAALLLITAVSAFVVGALAVGVTTWNLGSPVSSPAVTRFAVPLGEEQRFGEGGSRVLAISPDGSRVAFVAGRQLYLRSMSESDAVPIPGTEFPIGQVRAPVFSPDGQWIAFVSSVPAHIRKVAVTGGAAVTICDGCGPLGAMSWDGQGIVFAQGGQGLAPGFAGERAREGSSRVMRVAADGGEPQLLFNVTDGTPFDVQMLPDGDTVLFALVTGFSRLAYDAGSPEGEIVVQSLKSGQRKTLIRNGSAPRYLATGHIVYGREGVLFARHFDLRQSETTSEEFPVVDGVRRPVFAGASTVPTMYFDVSDTGSLVYVPGPLTATVEYDLAVLDPRIGIQPLKLPPNAYEFPRISRDGQWIAVGTNDGRTANIWLYDRSATNAIRQLTFRGRNRHPIWSPDGRFVTFQSDREGDLGLFRQRADGSGTAERLTKADPGTAHVPDSWSPDGNTLLFEVVKDAENALWAFSIDGGKMSRVGDLRIDSRGGNVGAVFSPNGRWLAYRSSSAGPLAVAVAPYPITGTQFVVGDGLHPVWSRDGDVLYFRRRTTGEFLATPVNTASSSFSFGRPQQLPITFPDRQSNSSSRNHDITPDGKFIGVVRVTPDQVKIPEQINVVLNWFEELNAKVPAR